MNSLNLKVNEQISIFEAPEKLSKGRLLFIKERFKLNTNIFRLIDGKTDVFSPVTQTEYEFYIEYSTKNLQQKYKKVIVSELCTYFNSTPVNRCVIEVYDDISIGEITSVRPTYTCEHMTIIEFKKVSEDGLHRYDIFLNNSYLGFVSEFGNYPKYNASACGLLHLDFEECSCLSKRITYHNECDSLSAELTDYKEKIIERFFSESLDIPKQIFSLNLLPCRGLTIVGVNPKNNHILVKTKSFEDYLVINLTTSFIIKAGRKSKHHYDKNHELCGKSVNVEHGFTIDSFKKLKEFCAILYIGEKEYCVHRIPFNKF